MKIDKDEFIFGLPIDTEFGKLRFLTYIEFTKYKVESYLFNQNVLHIYYMYKKDMKEPTPQNLESLEFIKNSKLREIVCTIPEFRDAYITILSLVFDSNEYTLEQLKTVIESILIDEDKFNYYRKLIQDMNMLIEDDVSEDETTQKWIEITRETKSEQGQPNSILNIVTSLAVGTPHSFKDIANLTVLQVNALFQKLSQFKSYDTTTLFATVSSDVKIESWAEIPDLFKKESLTIDGKDFSRKFGGLAD